MSEGSHMEIIWGIALLDEGFTSIPNLIIRNYRELGIEHGEFGFICQLLTYKHDSRDPFPGRDKLAASMKCSERQIDKWTKSLRSKGLLRTGRRRNVHNKQWDKTVYNFKPLLDAAHRLIGEKPLPAPADEYEVEWDDDSGNEPRVPEVRMYSGPEVRMGPVPEVRTKKKSKNNKLKYDCLIVAPAEVAAAAEVSDSDEIYEALQEHVPKNCFITGVPGANKIPLGFAIINEIYLMLINQFQNRLSPEVVRIACELYYDRSQNIHVENPTGLFHDAYRDAVKLWKAKQRRGKKRTYGQ